MLDTTMRHIINEAVDEEKFNAALNQAAEFLNKSEVPDEDKNKIIEELKKLSDDDKEQFIASPTTYGPLANFQDIETPEQKENAKNASTAVGRLMTDEKYKLLGQCIQQRFIKNPEDGEKLAEAILTKLINNRGTNATKWQGYLNENGKSKAMIQGKIIPTLAKAWGIEVPKRINDDNTMSVHDRNGKSAGRIVVPEGFNQAPIELGDQVVSMDFGYPAINFNSELITEILRESDKVRLKKLLNALIKRINGTPAGKAMLSFWGIRAKARSTLYKVIKEAASANGVPMVRRPLKASAETLTKHATDQNVQVTPINPMAMQKEVNPVESIHGLEGDPMLEGLLDIFGHTHSESEQQTFLPPIDVPARYLRHFYTVLAPSGSTGLHQYARYMDTDNLNTIKSTLGEETMNEIKEDNRDIADMLFTKYLEKTGGIPPFYILTPRTKPTKERLRVCDDTKVNGKVCIKSIDGKNKAAYFMPEKELDSIFEAG